MPDETKKPKLTPKTGQPSKRQGTALTIRGSAKWADWVRRGAEHCRTDSAKLIDSALIEYLKSRGFDEPPPKR